MIVLIIFTVSVILSLLITLIVKFICEKLKFYDIPANQLKDHKKPIPYAGTAIWFTFMLVLLGIRIFTSFETGTLHQLRGIVFGGTVIFLLGILDDKFEFGYIMKFFWQIVAAIILLNFDIQIKIFAADILNIAISIFWVVLVMNAINIIDVLDGLSSGISAICAIGFFAITLPGEDVYVNFAAITLAGVLAGFWFFNKPNAKVFMGDGGSLFVGFILASISMGADYTGVSIIGLFSPLLILGIPLYDTILVSYFRWRKGEPIFKGSKDHYALRLSKKGFSRWQIDIISYIISFILAVAAFLITVLSTGYAFFILIFIAVFVLIGSDYLDNIEV